MAATSRTQLGDGVREMQKLVGTALTDNGGAVPCTPGADLRQKASSATLPERPPLPSLLLPPLSSLLLPLLPFPPFSYRSRPLKSS